MHGAGSMRSVRMAAVKKAAFLSVFLLAVSPRAGVVTAQQVSTPGQTTHTTPGGLPSLDSNTSSPHNPDDPFAAQRQANMARSLANERQQKIVEDTARLLKLANELKTDVDKSNKNELSLDVVKKADEIERLAHDVKIRMRG